MPHRHARDMVLPSASRRCFAAVIARRRQRRLVRGSSMTPSGIAPDLPWMAWCHRRHAEQNYPGGRLGLPADGVGAVAHGPPGAGVRHRHRAVRAARLAVHRARSRRRTVACSSGRCMTVVAVGLVRVHPRPGGAGHPGRAARAGSLVGAWAIPRTVLVFLVVPPLLVTDGRSRACTTGCAGRSCRCADRCGGR